MQLVIFASVGIIQEYNPTVLQMRSSIMQDILVHIHVLKRFLKTIISNSCKTIEIVINCMDLQIKDNSIMSLYVVSDRVNCGFLNDIKEAQTRYNW